MADSTRRVYSDLDNLTTEELKGIVRADFSCEDIDEDRISYALELIAQREAAQEDGDGIDIDAAWETFHRSYCTEEGTGKSLYDSESVPDARHTVRNISPATKGIKQRKGFVSIRRYIAVIAATLVFTFGSMITVQATGVDVFGFLAQWTDEVFHYESTDNSSSAVWYSSLSTQNLYEDLLPTRIPDGYELAETYTGKSEALSYFTYVFCSGDNQTFSLEITTFSSQEYISDTAYEKNSTSVEEYISNGRTVYIFSNSEDNFAVCLDGLTEISVYGDLTRTQLEEVFDSIGGNTQ